VASERGNNSDGGLIIHDEGRMEKKKKKIVEHRCRGGRTYVLVHCTLYNKEEKRMKGEEKMREGQ
jgi:hypothetical protein